MAYCNRCQRPFPHDSALDQHERDSINHWKCNDCNKDFSTSTGRDQHYAMSHSHSKGQSCCGKRFRTDSAYVNHCNDAHHFCSSHRRFFVSSESLRQHYNDSGDHYYCTICDEFFDDIDDLLEHEEDHEVCHVCGIIFASGEALADHNESSHYYCRECDRLFQTPAGLKSHLSSSIHTPRTIACPGRKCHKSFGSHSALIMHAESNACPSGVTREAVNAFVARMDRQNVITNPARMVAGPGGYTAPAEMEYWATVEMWNGRAFECFLCLDTFRKLSALDAHLKSLRHRSRIYRCPGAECQREFPALSALWQHVVSGACGVGRNRQVQRMMDNLTCGLRTIVL